MAPKESKKGWEKERRDRLNIAFDNLGKLLPCFDPSIKLSKIEILEKARTYIQDLNRKINKPLNEESDKQEPGTEVNKLYERINKLLSRNELLNNLLKNAGIKTPKEYGFKNISPTKKWSQKITPNLAKILAQKEAQKENKPLKRKKTPKNSRPVQKVPVLKNKKVNVKARRRKKSATIRLQNLLPVTNVQPCYFISNSNNQGIKNLKQKSNVVFKTDVEMRIVDNEIALIIVNSSPLLSSNVKPTSQIINSNIPTFNTLPSTTLLLANNTVSTILPQPLFQNTPFIVKPSLPTYILVSTTQPSNSNRESFGSAVSDSSKVDAITKSLAPIRPKKRNVTTTTQINKVPIPALTSSYGNNYLVLSNNIANSKPSDKKAIAKKVKRSIIKKDGNKNVVEEPPPKKCKTITDSTSKESTLTNNANTTAADLINNNTTTEQKEKQIPLSDNTNNQSSNIVASKEELTNLKEQKLTNLEHDQRSESSSKPIVSVTSNILVTTSEVTATNPSDAVVSVKSVGVDSKIAATKPEDLITLKDTPNILSDKELLNSINNTTDKDIETIVNQTELSNDLFATLQVPTGSQNPESTSPTAAFLNAFPLVSNKIQEVLEDETSDSRRDTPTLLQIGTIDVTKTTQTTTDNLTPSLMNLDHFSFFNARDIYQPFDNVATTTTSSTDVIFTPVCVALARSTDKISSKSSKEAKIIYENSDNSFSVKSSTLPSVATTVSQNQVPLQSHNSGNANISVKHNLVQSISTANNHQKLNNNTTEAKLHVTPKSAVNVVKKNLFPTPSSTTNVNSIISSSYMNQICYTSVTSTMASSVSSLTYHSNKGKVSSEKYSKCNPVLQSSSIKNNQVPECNTLNPFNDIPKSTSTCSYNIPTTKSYSDIYGANTNYHYNYQTDLGTNVNSSKQYYNKDTANQSRYYGYDNYDNYKNDNYDSNNICSTAPNYYTDKNKFTDHHKPANKSTDVAPKAPVNWMTTPDLKQSQINSEFLLFPTNKDTDQVPSYAQNNFNNNLGQNSYFNASAPIYQAISSDYNMLPDPKKHFDLPFQKSDHEEHQINWSPTKHVGLDSSHNFGALPTLEGDLALGTQGPYLEPKLTPKKDLNVKPKEPRRNFDTPKKILSVSQFVEPFSKSTEIPAKVSNRRSSGGRVKTNIHQSNKNKRSNAKPTNEVVKDTASFNSKSNSKTQPNQYKLAQNQNPTQNSFIPDHNMWLSSNNSKSIGGNSTNKNISSGNYTAESLIGHHHPQNDVTTSHSKSARTNQQYNYPKSLPTPSFLPDNIMPYFPTMDMPNQENNNQHTQSYGTNSFPPTSFPVSIQNSYNNNYNLPTPSISTNYLQPPNYMPDLGNHDYGLLSDNIFSHTPNMKLNETSSSKTCSKTTPKVASNNTKVDQDNLAKKNQFNYSLNSNYLPHHQTSSQKKSKKKQGTEMTPNLSNIEFSFPLMPGNISSPILPDEFHSNFLPPPPNPHQLYPGKPPLYGTKQSSDLTSGNLLPLPPVTRSNIQHTEISPSNNIGSTLTNFNLSAIFPEINKIPVPSDNYIDYRTKHLPIPFNSKSNYTNSHSSTTATVTFTNP